jgi:uncharacterized protein (DUF39 family)/NAD-dependent dihydropyrimidine dehydrogenase PreA subunit
MGKTIRSINRKIGRRRAVVVTADEMTRIVREIGPERAAEQVDVVTTGTFGAMCSSGVWFNFGHADPPIKMSRVYLNDVEAYTGVAAVDAYLGATQPSEHRGIEYGGAHVIEDLVTGKSVVLRAAACGTDCYPRREVTAEITLDDVNQAIMSNPRNGYQRYNAAANSSDRILHTYMGKLLPRLGNVTFSGAGALSPLMNDPEFRTIGIGTRIFLGGAPGYIVGNGTQHNPADRFATLMVQGDLKRMSRAFLRAAVFPGYGCTLYIGLGVPIPVLDAAVAASTGIGDEEITTSVLDYGVAARVRPRLATVSYAQLKSGSVEIEGRRVPASPLSSFAAARRVAEILKYWIEEGVFFLAEPAERLPLRGSAAGMVERPPRADRAPAAAAPAAGAAQRGIARRDQDCIHCGLCLSLCPHGVYRRSEQWCISADYEGCTECGNCLDACPVGAIRPAANAATAG